MIYTHHKNKKAFQSSVEKYVFVNRSKERNSMTKHHYQTKNYAVYSMA